jgi:UDP-N-acetylglucosamine diphosphorylase / glucose-1-phosphate thymidylyltransferase / UDP-N-acetylgalactosamine diphosphorylase / glucosamine-1-phosphate N-acetyltransferase / galactosamine-1-phosphate N-acetyltransferase
MQYILVDIADREQFYPFSLTRSLAECRVGLYSFQERWEKFIGEETGIYTSSYLQVLYPSSFLNGNDLHTYINITIVPNDSLISQIKGLKEGEKLISSSGKWIATKTKEKTIPKILLADLPPIAVEGVEWVENSIDLLKRHASFIRSDFKLATQNRLSQKVNDTNRLIQEDQIFIEEGATVSCSNLNASEGPIYIGREAVIMEGASIRGPFVIGNKAVVKMNTSIYGSTSIGPYCLAGGEIKNSIIMGFSNKGHDGYLGDSIIGFWCNLGAGTSNSNVKNSAGQVQLWNEAQQVWDTVGQKMGMLVGDYSRFAIQSSINTGSYIGVSANVFGNGLLPKNLPNFTWGTMPGYVFEKVMEDIGNWKKMKGFEVTQEEQLVLEHLYKQAHL